MTRGSIGRRTTDGTTGAAAFELIAPLNAHCVLMEMHVTLAAATASTYGLGRPAAIGVTPTSPVTNLGEFRGATDVATLTVMRARTAVAWATGPTVPANFYRRVGFPATIATGVLWVFENGLYIPPGGSVVLWNLASNGVVDVSVVVDE